MKENSQSASNLSETGATVLFVASSFFGYARAISRAMEASGERVAWYEDRPAIDNVSKALIRVSPTIVSAKAERYFGNIINRHRSDPIRLVIIVKGEALSEYSVRAMKKAFRNAVFVLYFWDSYKNMPHGTFNKVQYFDRVLSFDLIDCENDKRLIYRPLFYRGGYKDAAAQSVDMQLLFLGTDHGDRWSITRKIARCLGPEVRFQSYFYHPSRVIFLMKSPMRFAYRKSEAATHYFVPKTMAEVYTLMSRAQTILDIERPIQTGFTMRTIETLAAGRKLITTNAMIRRADFYREQNVEVIDRKCPKITKDFFDIPFCKIDADVMRGYSIEQWLVDVVPSIFSHSKT